MRPEMSTRASGASVRPWAAVCLLLLARAAWAHPLRPPTAREAIVWRHGRACAGEICVDGDGEPADRETFEVAGADEDGRPILRFQAYGSNLVRALVDLTVDPSDLLDQVAAPASWSPASGAEVELRKGTLLVPTGESQLRWFDGPLCGEVPAAEVATSRMPVATRPRMPDRGDTVNLDAAFVVRATPGGLIVARTACAVEGAREVQALRWADRGWSASCDGHCLPRLEVLEDRGEHELVEVHGLRTRVRGWVESSAMPDLAVVTVLPAEYHYGWGLGRGIRRWPYARLPVGAPLYDGPSGNRVATVSRSDGLVPVCPDGRWLLVEFSTPWGHLALRARPRDLGRPYQQGAGRRLTPSEQAEIARRCPE